MGMFCSNGISQDITKVRERCLHVLGSGISALFSPYGLFYLLEHLKVLKPTFCLWDSNLFAFAYYTGKVLLVPGTRIDLME